MIRTGPGVFASWLALVGSKLRHGKHLVLTDQEARSPLDFVRRAALVSDKKLLACKPPLLHNEGLLPSECHVYSCTERFREHPSTLGVELRPT